MTLPRRSPQAPVLFFLALSGLAACGSPPQGAPATPPEAPPPEATRPEATRPEAQATAPVPASGPEAQRDCLLVVDGVAQVEDRCWVYPMGDGGLTLNTWTHGKPDRSHFAVVSVTRPGVADASWNQEPDDSHAWDALGEVTLQDGCWTNARVRICAR